MMIITFERTPFIMSSMAILIVYFMNASHTKRKMLITASIIIAVGAYSTLLIFAPYLKSSGVETLMRLAEMTNPLEAGSIHDRTDNYWGPSLDIIKANPIGVGIGNGSGTKASGQVDLSDSGNIQTHNELLQKTLETGILGGILFLLLMISILKDSLRLSKADDSKHRFGIAMTTCTLVFMMSSMITLTFSGGRGLTFWLLVGVTLSLLNKKNINKKKITDLKLVQEVK
jgi:O-antigen ligase